MLIMQSCFLRLVLNFIEKHQINEIDFIASHGHTILHKPNEGYTLQIGNGEIISKRTNQKVICDFRTQDVESWRARCSFGSYW